MMLLAPFLRDERLHLNELAQAYLPNPGENAASHLSHCKGAFSCWETLDGAVPETLPGLQNRSASPDSAA